MNIFSVFSAWVSKTRSVYHVFPVFLFAVFCWGTVSAHAASEITFSWRANPDEDYVIGYRLYFGGESRSNPDGTLKNDFQYAAYLDFGTSEWCENGEFGAVCDVFRPEEVQCDDLYGEVPRCTLYDLQGKLYFAMTAYNAQAESDYTYELSAFFEQAGSDAEVDSVYPDALNDIAGESGRTPSPQTLIALQQAYSLLLLNTEQ